MKTYSVIIAKETTQKDWCLYDNRDISVRVPTTEALLTARNEEHLKEKLEKHYSGYKIIRWYEVNL